MGEVQRSNCKRTTRKHLGMNKLLFGRERIRVFRIAGGEVLCSLWSISTTRQQSSKFISESTKKRLKFCKEIHITLYYQQKGHCLMKVMFLPKLCSQTQLANYVIKFDCKICMENRQSADTCRSIGGNVHSYTHIYRYTQIETITCIIFKEWQCPKVESQRVS